MFSARSVVLPPRHPSLSLHPLPSADLWRVLFASVAREFRVGCCAVSTCLLLWVFVCLLSSSERAFRHPVLWPKIVLWITIGKSSASILSCPWAYTKSSIVCSFLIKMWFESPCATKSTAWTLRVSWDATVCTDGNRRRPCTKKWLPPQRESFRRAGGSGFFTFKELTVLQLYKRIWLGHRSSKHFDSHNFNPPTKPFLALYIYYSRSNI